MNVFFRRTLFVLLTLLIAVAAQAGTLTVTSPTNGDYLGKSNTLRFNIVGASKKVAARVTVRGPGSITTTLPSQDFNPDPDGKVNGSIALNFGDTYPVGDYTITVAATEEGATYTDSVVNVRVDVVSPKFEEISPNTNSFVKGTVPIRLSVKETNVQDWRVKVNGQDIPNNTGTGNSIAVDWDTSTIEQDGSQTISVTVRDRALNEATQTIVVTLDRTKPTVSIVFPRSDSVVVSTSTLSVLVDVTDFSGSSVNKTGVDVIIKRTDGVFIARVSLISFRATSGTNQRWTGRLIYKKGRLPSQFKVVATVTDRAGNIATPQEVLIRLGR